MDFLELLGMAGELTGNSTLMGVSETTSTIFSVMSVFGIIFGAIECFFGYRLFRLVTTISGFFVGGLLGGIIGGIVSGEGAGALFGFLLIGILGGWLAFKLYKLAVFVTCFLGGGIIGLGIGLIGGEIELGLSLSPILGILAGVLGVIFTKPVIIIVTSFSGGTAMGAALDDLLNGDGLGTLLGILLGVVGVFLQYWMEKKDYSKAAKNAGGRGKLGKSELRVSSSGPSILNNFSQKGAVFASSAKTLFSNVKEQLLPIPTTTKSLHKCEGCKILAQSSTPLWAEGVPIVVTETYITSRENTAGVTLSFGFQNLGDQTVVAVCFSFKCFNPFQQELKSIEKLVVQDIMLRPGEVWFSDIPYRLPDDDTRRIEVVVRTIATEDGNVWGDETGVILSPLPEQKHLDLPKELTDELSRLGEDYQIEYNLRTICIYQPEDSGSYWNCTCGQLNTHEKCLACGLEKSAVFELTKPDFLRQKRELRLSEQKRLEEERRQKITEQAQEVKEGAEKMAQKSLEAARKGYAKSVTYSNQGMQRLIALWKNLKDQSYTFYTERIRPNKKKVLIISGAVMSVVLVIIVGLFGIQKYQSEQQAIKLAQQQAEEEAARLEAERQQEKEQQEKQQALRLEYEQLIAESPIYDGFTSGLIYAECWDMNQDDMQELLLLSASSGEINEFSSITVQLYASENGHMDLCDELRIDLAGGKADSRISLYQRGDDLYLGTYIRDEAFSNPTYIQYYAFDGTSFVLVDDLSSWDEWGEGGGQRHTYYSPENFNEVVEQYSLLFDLFTFNYYDGASFNRGILPEPDLSLDTQRRIALLDVLNQTGNIEYAKLVDINQDGQEDLLTLYTLYQADTGIASYYFRSYVWDGQQVYEVDLSQTGDAEIDSYLEMGFGSYALYQKTDSGQLYACYDGEIVGGWGGTLFVNLLDPSDYGFCGYPFIGSDYSPELYTAEEIMELEAQYAEEEEAYNAFVDGYQRIEYVYDIFENPEAEKTVQLVIQKLENG